MKIKALHLDASDYSVKKAGDRQPLVRNPGKTACPNHKHVEYMRALAAAKLDRMFAKPFVAALDGHVDSVTVLARSRKLLSAPVVSGSADGGICFWDISSRGLVWQNPTAHVGCAVMGVVVSNDDRLVYSVGGDKAIRAWSQNSDTPVRSLEWSSSLTSVDHHWSNDSCIVTTCSQGTVDVWDFFKSNTPVQSFQWGDSGVLSSRFHPSEYNLLATSMGDNSVGLFDIRTSSGIQKIYLKNKSNAIAWNPRDPFVFAVGNDDGNVYQMDMRKVGAGSSAIVRMHTGHVQAVLDVEYSPLGTELVSGGYDKTVRIFALESQKAREIFHTKRMQRIGATRWTGDGRFVLSGSEDGNVRVWKANASEKLGVVDAREKRALEYRKSLTERYQHVEEIGKIVHNRRVPKWVKNEGKRRADHFESQKIAETNKAQTGNLIPKKTLEKPIRRVEQ